MIRAEVLMLDDLPGWVRLSPRVEAERPLVERIALKLRDGDTAALDRVLRELLPRVRRWTQHLLGPQPDVDDAVQDALAAIAAALHRFEGRSSLETLSHRIVVRTASRYFGRARRTVPLELERDLADETPGPEQVASTRQRVERLYAHLSAISETRRTAFILCVVEELSPTEAAEVVGCSSVAMRSRLFDARRELEERLAREASGRAQTTKMQATKTQPLTAQDRERGGLR